MSKLAVFMPNEETIVQLELDDYTICGDITKLQTNVTKDDMIDLIDENIRLMMTDDPEDTMDHLHQESLDELEDDIWDEDYVCGAGLDLIGTVHENDDGSLNYFETTECGQCISGVNKLANNLQNKDLVKLISQVVAIWQSNMNLNDKQCQEVEKLFDTINDLTGFTDMSQDEVAEDVLDALDKK